MFFTSWIVVVGWSQPAFAVCCRGRKVKWFADSLGRPSGWIVSFSSPLPSSASLLFCFLQRPLLFQLSPTAMEPVRLGDTMRCVEGLGVVMETLSAPPWCSSSEWSSTTRRLTDF